MEYSVCTFGIALTILLLITGISEARSVEKLGLLDEMPQNCSGADFCPVKHDNYPQEKIDELLTTKYQLTLAPSHEVPTDRDGTIDEPQNDCQKTVTYGEIYEILDENDNVRVVVQSPKIFKQQLRIEQCVDKGRLMVEGGTDHFDSEELKNNNIVCVEKKLDYNFVVLTTDGNGVESVKSKHGIPVCCSCRLNF